MLKYKIDVLIALKAAGYNTTKILNEGLIGQSSVQKIRKGIVVGNTTINKICGMLNMQPGDIIEYVPEKEDKNE